MDVALRLAAAVPGAVALLIFQPSIPGRERS